MKSHTLTLRLGSQTFGALKAAANERGISVEQLIDELLSSASDGLRRPGAWEREHVEALLAPFDAARIDARLAKM